MCVLGSMFVSTVKRLRVLKSTELSAFTRELENLLWFHYFVLVVNIYLFIDDFFWFSVGTKQDKIST